MAPNTKNTSSLKKNWPKRFGIIQPGDPILFASGSLGAVSFAREMMMNGTETNVTNIINRNKIVVFDKAKRGFAYRQELSMDIGECF
jgi:hypothetical protein